MSMTDLYPTEQIPDDIAEPISMPIEEQLHETGAGAADGVNDTSGMAPDGSIAMPQLGSALDPLYVVNEASDFGYCGQYPLTAIPVRIVSTDRNRQAIVLTNTSNANVMFLAFTSGAAQANAASAYPLNPLTTITLPYEGEVWASTSGGANVAAVISISKAATS